MRALSSGFTRRSTLGGTIFGLQSDAFTAEAAMQQRTTARAGATPSAVSISCTSLPLDADLLGTLEHLEMRQTQSKAVMDAFNAWLLAEQGRPDSR